jgi:hypothetical protein
MRIAIFVFLILTVLLLVYSALLVAGVGGSPNVDAIQTLAGGSITLLVALLGYTLKSLDSRLAVIEKHLQEIASDFSSRLAAVEAALDIIKASLDLK